MRASANGVRQVVVVVAGRLRLRPPQGSPRCHRLPRPAGRRPDARCQLHHQARPGRCVGGRRSPEPHDRSFVATAARRESSPVDQASHSDQRRKDDEAAAETKQSAPGVHASNQLVDGPPGQGGSTDSVDGPPSTAAVGYDPAQRDGREEQPERDVRKLSDGDLAGLSIAEQPVEQRRGRSELGQCRLTPPYFIRVSLIDATRASSSRTAAATTSPMNSVWVPRSCDCRTSHST